MSNTLAAVTNQLSIADLRGYAMPEPIGFFPLSGPAWVFLVLVVVCLAGWLWHAVARHRKRAYRRAGLALLANLEADTGKNTGYEISVVLKRAALVAYPRVEVAGLYGEDWVDFLKRSAPEVPWPENITAPDANLASLFDSAKAWLRQHREAAEVFR